MTTTSFPPPVTYRRIRRQLSRFLARLEITARPWLRAVGLPGRRASVTQAQARRRQLALAELGARLREAREYRHLSLAAAALATQIRVEHLAALEAGDLRALPGRAYTRAFVRTYGRYLGLDPDDLLALLPSLPERAPGNFPTMPTPRAPNFILWVTVGACVILFSCVGWLALQAALQAIAPPPSQSVLDAPGPRSAPVVLDAQPPTPSPTPTPPVNLVVRAREPISLLVTLDNAVVFSGTLEAGQSRYWSAETVRLRTSNAAATEVIYNGQPRPTLGRRGETVELEWGAPPTRPAGTPGPAVFATATSTPLPPPPIPTGERPR
ncbi:MAG: helix-turn-helix domain-containing protein [Chloroflexota bacterium]|nr:helix-turn-helix domain-containing protein [Dehalococcoidia bacterium]MDW8252712.1 helix-turn-helix domain-containing protein [Chloroflexota bacterium]